MPIIKIIIDSQIIKNKDIRMIDKLVLSIIESLSIDGTFEELISRIQRAFGIPYKSFNESLERLKSLAFVDQIKVAERKGEPVAIQVKLMKQDNISKISETIKDTKAQQEKEKEEKRISKLSMNAEEESSLKRIIGHLNEKTQKHFRTNTKSVKTLILPLLRNNEYQEEDFIKVIDNMCSRWLDNPKMKQYLRPSTLFTNEHMDKYLNMGVEEQGTQLSSKRKERDEKRKQAGSKGWG